MGTLVKLYPTSVEKLHPTSIHSFIVVELIERITKIDQLNQLPCSYENLTFSNITLEFHENSKRLYAVFIQITVRIKHDTFLNFGRKDF